MFNGKKRAERKAFQAKFEEWQRRAPIEIARAIALDGLTGEWQAQALARIEQAEAEAELRDRSHGHIRDYHKRDRQIRRDGARMAWWTCPPAVAMFAAVARLHFIQADRGMTLLYVVFALAFLVLLALAQWLAR